MTKNDGMSERIGKAMRQTYMEAGLTQEEVGRRVGVDQNTVSQWALGQQELKVYRLLDFEKACGVPPGYVLRLAGIIKDPATTEQAIEQDTALDQGSRQLALSSYRLAVDQTKRARGTRKKVRR
jgi:transcriptional regulator with XRE-family HTH domain